MTKVRLPYTTIYIDVEGLPAPCGKEDAMQIINTREPGLIDEVYEFRRVQGRKFSPAVLPVGRVLSMWPDDGAVSA